MGKVEDIQADTTKEFENWLRASNNTVAETIAEALVEGRKFDQEKLRWDLVPWDSVEQIVDVLTYGAKKYAPDNWKSVPEGRTRYFAALCRHLFAWWRGEKIDPESGKPHLAHAGCCVLFLLFIDK